MYNWEPLLLAYFHCEYLVAAVQLMKHINYTLAFFKAAKANIAPKQTNFDDI